MGLALALSAASGCTPAAEPLPVEFPLVLAPIPPCIPVIERIQHLDQPSDLGFSAVELLARVAGESVSPLVWLPPDPSPEYILAYGPESGLSNLRLRVAPAEGEVRYRQELVSNAAPEGTECADDVLEVPVSVSILSGTQALDETFLTRLEAHSVYRAQFSHSFGRRRLSGGFAVTDLTSLDPERTFAAGALSLQVVLWEGGSQGSLSTEIQSYYTPKAGTTVPEAWPASLAGAESTHLAVWPSAEPCSLPSSNSLPSDAKVLGFSVTDVLAALTRQGPRELTWSNGETTALELDFVTPASDLCQGVAEALTFDTAVRVRTSDARVDVEVPVQISADNQGGTIGEITVQTTESPAAAALPVAATLTSPGKRSAAGFSQVRVDLDASFGAEQTAGTLTLSGIGTGAPSFSPALGETASAPARELASGRWSR